MADAARDFAHTTDLGTVITYTSDGSGQITALAVDGVRWLSPSDAENIRADEQEQAAIRAEQAVDEYRRIFDAWLRERDAQERNELARVIRDMPARTWAGEPPDGDILFRGDVIEAIEREGERDE